MHYGIFFQTAAQELNLMWTKNEQIKRASIPRQRQEMSTCTDMRRHGGICGLTWLGL